MWPPHAPALSDHHSLLFAFILKVDLGDKNPSWLVTVTHRLLPRANEQKQRSPFSLWEWMILGLVPSSQSWFKYCDFFFLQHIQTNSDEYRRNTSALLFCHLQGAANSQPFRFIFFQKHFSYTTCSIGGARAFNLVGSFTRIRGLSMRVFLGFF